MTRWGVPALGAGALSRRGFAAYALSALLAAALGGCPHVPDEPACKQTCARLQICGLLPSPLGAKNDVADAVENCAARCQLSDVAVRDQVVGCTKRVSPANVGCPEGECGACFDRASCGNIAACLESAFPLFEGKFLGQSRGQLLPVTEALVVSWAAVRGEGEGGAGGGSASACASIPGALVCEQCDSGAELTHGGRPKGLCKEPMNDDGWCGVAGVSTLRPFVLEGSPAIGLTYLEPELSCAARLLRSVDFDAVSPGPVRFGFEVRGSTRQKAPGPEEKSALFCHVFYTPPFLLKAGREDQCVQVSLPRGVQYHDLIDDCESRRSVPGRGSDACDLIFRCEEGDRCADGSDNDNNGLVDCDDPKCQCSTGPGGGAGASGGEAGAAGQSAGGAGGEVGTAGQRAGGSAGSEAGGGEGGAGAGSAALRGSEGRR